MFGPVGEAKGLEDVMQRNMRREIVQSTQYRDLKEWKIQTARFGIVAAAGVKNSGVLPPQRPWSVPWFQTHITEDNVFIDIHTAEGNSIDRHMVQQRIVLSEMQSTRLLYLAKPCC